MLKDDKLKTEREVPPHLLGPDFACKHFPQKQNQYFHLHGGIEFDVGTPPLNDITEEMKVSLKHFFFFYQLSLLILHSENVKFITP